jgi:hypothetical protein
MSTPNNQQDGTQSDGMTFDAAPVQQDTPVQGTPDSGMKFDAAPVQQDTVVPAAQTKQVVQPTATATISAIHEPTTFLGKFGRWAENVSNDMKYGTDETGIGTVLKKMGAHGVYMGNPEAVGDFMASLPLGLLKAAKGTSELAPAVIGGEKGRTWQGMKDVVGGGLQAIEIPSAFVAPEAGEIAAEGAGKAASLTSKAGSKAVDAAKAVETWAKANPLKAVALEGVAHELGIDPIQLTHKVIKYGKGLFATP